MPSVRSLATMLAVSLLALPCALSGGQVFHGTVIDAESKRPLVGAAVVVIWRKQLEFAADGNQLVHKVAEVLTGADGGFAVDDAPGPNWSILTVLAPEPDVTIYFPGYGPFPFSGKVVQRGATIGRATGMSRTELSDALRAGVVIELPRLRDRRELLESLSQVRTGIRSDVAPSQVTNLVRLLDTQERALAEAGNGS